MGQTFPEGINIGLPGAETSIVPDRSGVKMNKPPIWVTTGVSQTPSFSIRTRVTLAEMNAGKSLIGASAGGQWRVLDFKCISIGGDLAATAAATGYAIYGTISGTSTALFTVLLAAATRGAVCSLGTANTTNVTDGAATAKLDQNTAITCKAVSAGAFDLITSTFFDIILTVALEVA